MGLIGVIIASIINIFLARPALQFAISIIGILVFVRPDSLGHAVDTTGLQRTHDAETHQKLAVMGGGCHCT